MNQALQRLLEACGGWQERPPDHPESRSRFEALLDAIMEERPRVRRPELLAAIHRRWLA